MTILRVWIFFGGYFWESLFRWTILGFTYESAYFCDVIWTENKLKQLKYHIT